MLAVLRDSSGAQWLLTAGTWSHAGTPSDAPCPHIEAQFAYAERMPLTSLAGKKKWFWLMRTWFGASVRSSLLLLGICQVLRCLCAAGLPAGCPSTAPRSCTATGPSGGPHIPLGHSPSSSCPANMLWAARGCARGSPCSKVLLEQQRFERRPLSWALGTAEVCGGRDGYTQ